MKLVIETDSEVIRLGDNVKINTSNQDEPIVGYVVEIFKSVWSPHRICIGIKGIGTVCEDVITEITKVN